MARERQPERTLDSLQPDGTRRSFWATWTEYPLCAYAELAPIQDDPRNGYTLDCWYERKTTRGATGQRQEEQGDRLAAQVRAYMQAALLDAGWTVKERGKNGATSQIWTYPRPPLPALIQQEAMLASFPQSVENPTQRTIEVYGSKEARERGQPAAYRRIISLRPVVVICTRCGREETQQRYPGPLPRYCRTCDKEATRERTRQRVQRFRQRQSKNIEETTE